MRIPEYSTQFRRDVKRAEKRGKDMSKLKELLGLLIDGEPLPARYKDHPLKTKLAGLPRCPCRAGLGADLRHHRRRGWTCRAV
jgi:addiction module RelE/StbE family toxin